MINPTFPSLPKVHPDMPSKQFASDLASAMHTTCMYYVFSVLFPHLYSSPSNGTMTLAENKNKGSCYQVISGTTGVSKPPQDRFCQLLLWAWDLCWGSESHHIAVLSAGKVGLCARNPSSSENLERENEKLRCNWFYLASGDFFTLCACHQEEKK